MKVRTLVLLWALAIVTSMMIFDITYNPQWSFGDIVQVIVAGVLILAGIPTIISWSIKRYRKCRLFKPEYQHSQTAIAFSHEIDAALKEQRVQITLRMALETHVEFVAILNYG